MRTLILLTAVPGAGKSTWARRYAESHKNVYIVNSDEVRHAVTGSYRDFSKQDMVWATFRREIHEYGKKCDDVTVIADGVNDTNQIRLSYALDTKEFDRHILVYIVRPLEVIIRQNRQREVEKWVPDEVVETYFKKIEEPNEAVRTAYDECIIVS